MSTQDLFGGEYYVSIPKRICANTSLSQSAKLLYGQLADLCLRGNTHHGSRSQLALAASIGLKSAKQIERATQELVDAGEITVTKERRGSRWFNVYWLRSIALRADIPVQPDPTEMSCTSDQTTSNRTAHGGTRSLRSRGLSQRATATSAQTQASWPLWDQFFGSTLGNWADLRSYERRLIDESMQGLEGGGVQAEESVICAVLSRCRNAKSVRYVATALYNA